MKMKLIIPIICIILFFTVTTMVYFHSTIEPKEVIIRADYSPGHGTITKPYVDTQATLISKMNCNNLEAPSMFVSQSNKQRYLDRIEQCLESVSRNSDLKSVSEGPDKITRTFVNGTIQIIDKTVRTPTLEESFQLQEMYETELHLRSLNCQGVLEYDGKLHTFHSESSKKLAHSLMKECRDSES